MTGYVVTLCGIGENIDGRDPLPMLTQFVDRLGEEWEHLAVPYPAAYGFVNGAANPAAPDYETTKRRGREQARIQIAAIVVRDPGAVIVLAGYSAGADIVDDLAVAGIMDEYPQVKLCVVVANPSNPGSNGLADYGIAAPERGRQFVDSRVFTVNHPKDVICCCPANSPLRVIAKLTPRMALGDRSVWHRDVWRKLTDPRERAEIARYLGPWWDPRSWGRWTRARTDAEGYLTGGAHTIYDVRPRGGELTMLERAADDVKRRLS